MITSLQILAILLCSLGITYQAVGLHRGTSRNLNVLWCFIFAVIGLIISVPAIQSALDLVLPSIGYANLFLRLDLYVLFALVGYTVLKASGEDYLSRLIMGYPGGVFLLFFVGVTFATFFLSNNLQDSESAAYFLYVLAWRGHMAFVALVLLASALPRVFSALSHPITRVSSALYSLAFVEVVAMFFVAVGQAAINSSDDVLAVMMYSAAVMCALATMVALFAGWVSSRRQQTRVIS